MAFKLITTAYFDRVDLFLPNTDPHISEGSILNQTIDDVTNDYLAKILGEDLANDFLNGIANVTDNTPTADAKWLNLLFGKRVGNSFDYKWLGFSNHNSYQNVGNNYKKSPLANYVYSLFMNYRATSTIGQGEALATFENATNSMPTIKMCKAWNNMVDMHYNLHNFIMANLTDYPNYIGVEFPPIENYNNRLSNGFVNIHYNNNLSANQLLFIKQNILSI